MIKIIFFMLLVRKKENTNMQLGKIMKSSRMTQPNAITIIQETDMETCDDEMVFTALIKKDTKICNDLKIE